jgi:hypothetical protein
VSTFCWQKCLEMPPVPLRHPCIYPLGTCIYMCVCVCVCIYIHTHTYTHIHFLSCEGTVGRTTGFMINLLFPAASCLRAMRCIIIRAVILHDTQQYGSEDCAYLSLRRRLADGWVSVGIIQEGELNFSRRWRLKLWNSLLWRRVLM